MAEQVPIPVEFSRILEARRIGSEMVERELEANADECAALAKRFGLLALDRLCASLHLEPYDAGRLIRLSGHVKATFTQQCVVTLKALPGDIDFDFETFYERAPSTRHDTEIIVDVDEEDPPEAIPPEGLDLGEAVVQQLAEHLDPYPRASDAQLEPGPWAQGDAENEAHEDGGAFAALSRLKQSN